MSQSVLMNPVIGRALAGRAVALVAVLGVMSLLIESAHTNPPPPWPLIFGFFGIVGGGNVIISVYADRKLAIRSGRWHPASDNADFTVFASVPIPFSSAINVASQAMSSIGAKGVEVIDGRAVVGWIGTVFTNLPKWQQYEVAIDVTRSHDGRTRFAALARPRFAIAAFGSRRSEQLRGQLQEQVMRAAGYR
jgi:hypothetical protein